MKKLSFLVGLLLLAIPSMVFAQTTGPMRSVDSYQYYSIGSIDFANDLYSDLPDHQYSIVGSAGRRRYARMIGGVWETGGAPGDIPCYIKSIPNNPAGTAWSDPCWLGVAIGGPVGAAGTKVMDGTFIPNTDIGLEVVSGNYAFDTSAGQFEAIAWQEMDGSNLAAADGGIVTASATYALDTGANMRAVSWLEVGTDLTVNEAGMVTISYLQARDPTDTAQPLDLISTHADAQPLTYNGLVTGSYLYGYNGTSMDLLRVGASNELQVTDVATRPGEDSGNDWRKIKKEETAVYNPAVTAGTAVDDAGTDIICASTYLLNTPNIIVWAKNAGGGSADDFNDVDVQASYNDADWVSLTSTTCDSLTSGNAGICFEGSNKAYAYIRVIADCAGGEDTTADCVIQGNKN